MGLMTACRSDSPLMKTWEDYQKTEDYRNSFNWATRTLAPEIDRDANGELGLANSVQRGAWVKGSLWAAFMQGFLAATERAAGLHEQVNPASDEERDSRTPGSGGMGAVIQYRDLIRQQAVNT